MENKTICIDTNLGQRLDSLNSSNATHLVFMGKDISLTSKVTLGRDDKNTVVLDGNLISRFHAEIQRIGHDYFIKDLNSKNGTYVNEIPVPRDKYIKLQDSDVVRLGRHEISLVRSQPDVIKTKSISDIKVQ